MSFKDNDKRSEERVPTELFVDLGGAAGIARDVLIKSIGRAKYTLAEIDHGQ